MSYPTYGPCEECERLRTALTEAHEKISAAETRGWNAAIDAALSILNLGYWGAKIERLRKPAT